MKMKIDVGVSCVWNFSKIKYQTFLLFQLKYTETNQLVSTWISIKQKQI